MFGGLLLFSCLLQVGVLYLVIVVKGLVCFKKGHARFTDKTENEMDIVEMPLRYK